MQGLSGIFYPGHFREISPEETLFHDSFHFWNFPKGDLFGCRFFWRICHYSLLRGYVIMSLDEFVPGFASAAAGEFRCFIFQFKKEVLTYEQQSHYY